MAVHGFGKFDPLVKEGLNALEQGHKNKFNFGELNPRSSLSFDAANDLDSSLGAGWDYYVGVAKKKRDVSELYLEVHAVNEEEVGKILKKAQWLSNCIAQHGWPQTDGRPFFIAPTAGISPFSLLGVLRKKLALAKVDIVMKGDSLADRI